MADTDSSGSRQDREQAELRTAGIEQSPGDSGLSRTGKDEQVKGGGYELNEPRPMEYSESEGSQGSRLPRRSANPDCKMADPGCERSQGLRRTREEESLQAGQTLPLYPPGLGDRDGWAYMLSVMPEAQPTFCRTLDGPSAGVDIRLRAVGNGVVPAVAALAFRTLARELKIEGLLKN